MTVRNLRQLYRDEFRHYNFSRFRQDLLAGLTVAAVSLPLALAFGVASGANAVAGLVTAIIAGFIIGALSGAPYQISGPTGAMSAILIVLVQKFGLQGIFIAGLMSGAFLTLIGILRLGRFIAFIPAPVITGFTSGIALIIFIGQLDNFLGVSTPSGESAALKFIGYFKGGFTPDWHSIVLGLLVILIMVLVPKKIAARFPSSLMGIIFVTALNVFLKWDVAMIGKIPQTLLLTDRLNLTQIPWADLPDLLGPALTITALGAIESLLCGTVGANMTGIPLQANQELVAQGVGNMVIPFFGGVPATAAIARSSVGIKSGGQTRLVSIIHAVGLLLSMFLLAPLMARIPLAALAGVLMVTAWRMNEWKSIQFIFGKRFKLAMLSFFITMLATISLDLTQAILIGTALSAVIFINNVAQLQVAIAPVDPDKLLQKGIRIKGGCEHISVAYLTGPLFFAAVGGFNEAFAHLKDVHVIILSMRGVPLMDTSGVEAVLKFIEKVHHQGGRVMISGAHPAVLRTLQRSGAIQLIGEENLFWSSDQAIIAAENQACAFCQNDNSGD